MGDGLMQDSQVFSYVLASTAKYLGDATACATTGCSISSFYQINAFDPNWGPGPGSASAWFSIVVQDRGETGTMANTWKSASGVKAWTREPVFWIYSCSHYAEADPYLTQLRSMTDLVEHAFRYRHGFTFYEFSTPTAPTDTGERLRVIEFGSEMAMPFEDPEDSRLFKTIHSVKLRYYWEIA